MKQSTILIIASVLLFAYLSFAHVADVSHLAGRSREEVWAEFKAMPRGERSSERSNGCQGCAFAFESPIMPSFDLPPTQPNSPGDITLNVGNPIVMANGNPLSQGCNGNFAQVLVDGVWTPYYPSANGQQRQLIHVFYASGSNLRISTLQTWQSELADYLSGKQIRLDIRCNNNVESCINFYVNATPKVDTCDECAGLINRTAERERIALLQAYHAKVELEDNDLPATLETFTEGGNVIFYGSGMGGVGRYGPTGSASIEDFYGNYVMNGKLLESQENFGLVELRSLISDTTYYSEFILSFNHTAELLAILPGVPPTNKFASFPLLAFFEFNEDDLMVEERVFWDQATVLKQLGLITDPTLPIVDGDFFNKLVDPLSGPPLNQWDTIEQFKRSMAQKMKARKNRN